MNNENQEPLEQYLRPEVQAFARLMERELRENDWKGGWQDMTPIECFIRLQEEVDEVESLIVRPAVVQRELESEAADVANFCMMLVEVSILESDR